VRPCRIVSAPARREPARPAGPGRFGRRAFVSGKKKQNTIKPTMISDGAGRLLWAGAFRPGRMHDVTAVRTDGIEDLLRQHPKVQAEVDSGYQGLARDFPGQVSAPPRTPPLAKPPAGSSNATSSPQPGSVSSTRSPSPSSGGPCNGGPDGATTSRKPPWPSPGWPPTGPPHGNQPWAGPPDQDGPDPIVHLLVRQFCDRPHAGSHRPPLPSRATWARSTETTPADTTQNLARDPAVVMRADISPEITRPGQPSRRATSN
jgi:hypothetical protein